jgi:CelD/BcsL family acetyltransferase involved in cellulose biosynthesis
MYEQTLRPDYAEPICEIVLEAAILRCACDAVIFGAVSASWPAMEALQRAVTKKASIATMALQKVRSPHTVFHLPGSFDAYVASLSKNHRHNYRRSLKHLEASGLRMETITEGEELHRGFVEFQEMHARQWTAEGKLGHFGDWPRASEFHTQLLKSQAAQGRARLCRFSVAGKVVSYYYCYAFGACHHQLLAAREVGAEWDRLGLGRVGQVKTIERAIAEGAARIDAGPGHYDYKLQLGGTEYPLMSMMIMANRFGSRLRGRSFAALADVLHLLYYRIWFKRLAVRLPLRRRPLWEIWIRSRL